jgi:hypothetical protein
VAQGEGNGCNFRGDCGLVAFLGLEHGEVGGAEGLALFGVAVDVGQQRHVLGLGEFGEGGVFAADALQLAPGAEHRGAES